MSSSLPYERPSDEVTVLADVEASAPPEKVLEVSVVRDHVFLTISTCEEDNQTTTLTKVAHVQVDADYLIAVIREAKQNQMRFQNRRMVDEMTR